ncbi:MAG TPA: hypothetical protein DHW02_02980, partial [Ktedonobacter sp.]|nr:hypothetical protein [Ktedonobacter sp.]
NTLNDENGRTSAPHIPRRPLLDQLDTVETPSIEALSQAVLRSRRIEIPSFLSYANHIASLDTNILPTAGKQLDDDATLLKLPVPSIPPILPESSPASTRITQYRSVPLPAPTLTTSSTLSILQSKTGQPRYTKQARHLLTAQTVLLLIGLFLIVVFHAISSGANNFTGPQGWAYVLGGSSNQTGLLTNVNKNLQSTYGTSDRNHIHHLTPQQFIDTLVQHMTLDQKLGQMMLVQFMGPDYSLDLSTMISQYNVGAVLIFATNQNIKSKTQLHGVIQQMQHNSQIPLAISIDQEGGVVDRLASLDGSRPSATTIGATNNPNVAKQEGIQDAQDLASYGINLNLAPVVDVTNVYNPQMVDRTFGNNATLVTHMAGAYLQGLQQSGKVLGTLKHFPGLGDVGVDPHSGVPYLYRSKDQLEQIDWSPYRTLIAQGNVHTVMVTHEIVQAVDSTKPSSLSYNLVTGVLRHEFGFNGVIITDSLTMEGILAYYNEGQAAALAVEAGDDLLMGASTPSDVATMIQGIKQAMDSGQISQQRIDDSVRRILMLKYDMGLLPLPT